MTHSEITLLVQCDAVNEIIKDRQIMLRCNCTDRVIDCAIELRKAETGNKTPFDELSVEVAKRSLWDAVDNLEACDCWARR